MSVAQRRNADADNGAAAMSLGNRRNGLIVMYTGGMGGARRGLYAGGRSLCAMLVMSQVLPLYALNVRPKQSVTPQTHNDAV